MAFSSEYSSFGAYHYKPNLLGIEHFPSTYLEVLGIWTWYLEIGFDTWNLDFGTWNLDRVLGIAD